MYKINEYKQVKKSVKKLIYKVPKRYMKVNYVFELEKEMELELDSVSL